MKILAYIPARAGSTRIKNKNIRNFLGKPLIAYTIEMALDCEFVDRVIVDTDSPKIARIAKKYGAEVPFLRPKKFATAKAQVIDSILNVLNRLKKDEGYNPDYLLLLQPTSPLREKKDIEDCIKLMKKGGADSVVTVSPTHPRLFYFSKQGYLQLANKVAVKNSNVQAWPEAYLLNGCIVYLTKIKTILQEKTVLPKKTKAIVCPKWRSVDVDTPEEWVMAEIMHKNKKQINERIKKI